MRIHEISMILIVLLINFSCSTDEENFTKWEAPMWEVESKKLLPNSFTIVLSLPHNLNLYATDDDKIAAFINEECRGVGNLVKDEKTGKGIYFITIRASDTESGQIVIKYYNARLKYLYESKQTYPFKPDGTLGSYDEPVEIIFRNL